MTQPLSVVILQIRKISDKNQVNQKCKEIESLLLEKGIRAKFDDDQFCNAGYLRARHQNVPTRIEVGTDHNGQFKYWLCWATGSQVVTYEQILALI